MELDWYYLFDQEVKAYGVAELGLLQLSPSWIQAHPWACQGVALSFVEVFFPKFLAVARV
jgi:hypothetical protein